MTPHMRIVLAVLESANDAGIGDVVAACRRLIMANTIGWRRHHNPRDWETVKLAWEEINGI